MNEKSQQFASQLAKTFVQKNEAFRLHPGSDVKIETNQTDDSVAVLDLTPFNAKPAPVSAETFFTKIVSAENLIAAYHQALASLTFEQDLRGVKQGIEPYAKNYIERLLKSAESFSAHQISLVANFVKNLDVYCAVKAVESLLNSKADIATLEVAEKKGWSAHFDHLAIRCASEGGGDAKNISSLLIEQHQYVQSQVKEESHYQFPDGWNAYPVYKILENGQVLRVFIDQSDVGDKEQIIQHWNRVYGYTAHHLAMRTTRIIDGIRVDVPLDELMAALTEYGISILTPTGHYTSGLLLQVFSKPELNQTVPANIKEELKSISEKLDRTIENGKLLELVSRKEMPMDQAKAFYDIYGLTYDVNNPLHSVPIYTYFLPVQAAHVIKTSQAIS